MGRYRPLVEQLVLFSHEASRSMFKKLDMGDGIFLSPIEWQVLEYVYEHGEDERMASIHDKIGLAQSSFSKCVRALSDYGLVERFHTVSNRKNVIVKITEKGIALYERMAVVLRDGPWGDFFAALSEMNDEDLARMHHAMVLLNQKMPSQPREDELIKIE